jgi:hypothetical protein
MRSYAKKRHKAVEDKRPPRTPPTPEDFADIARRSTKIIELRMLWRNAKDMGLLTGELKAVLTERVTALGGSLKPVRR